MPCLGRCNAPKRGSGGRFLEGGWFYQVKLAIYHKPDYALPDLRGRFAVSRTAEVTQRRRKIADLEMVGACGYISVPQVAVKPLP
jgi:hypothetical protein